MKPRVFFLFCWAEMEVAHSRTNTGFRNSEGWRVMNPRSIQMPRLPVNSRMDSISTPNNT